MLTYVTHSLVICLEMGHTHTHTHTHTNVTLVQWFSAGVLLPLKGHWAVSGDIFGSHNLGGMGATGI